MWPFKKSAGTRIVDNTSSVSAVRKSSDEQMKAACALNMCMVSLSQIVDYQDLDILRMEYEAVLNNLNLEKVIKDEAMLSAFRSILDTCHFYILHAKDKEMLSKKQQARLKGALSKALGGGNVMAIFSGNPWAIAAGAAAMVGVAAVNYKSQRDQAKLENELEEWQLERSALEQLHNLRRTLFETAWRLAKEYDFPDEYRLTEKQITVYNDIIKDADPQNRYERMWLIRDSFKAYPPFWYYLSRAALETSDAYRPDDAHNARKRLIAYGIGDKQLCDYYRAKAKDALEVFRRSHEGNELLREDLICASAYLDDAQLCGPGEEERMLDDVNRARKIAGMDAEVIQSCAFRYLQLLAHYGKSEDSQSQDRANQCREGAIYCLKFLLDRDFNPELNGRALSKVYIDKADTDAQLEYKILKDCTSRKCPFVYQRIFAWDAKSMMDDWRIYLFGPGLKRTAFNFFYATTLLAYKDFFAAMAEARRSSSYVPLKILRDNNWDDPSEECEDQTTNGGGEKAKRIAKKILDVYFDSASPWLGMAKGIYDKHIGLCEDGEKDDSLVGLMKKMLYESYERVGYKLWIGTRAAEYSMTSFEKLERDIFEALKTIAKDEACAFAADFVKEYQGCSSFDYQAMAKSKKEPEALEQISQMEHEVERLRLEVQETLGVSSYRFPDPEFPSYEEMLQLSKQVGLVIDGVKEYGEKAIAFMAGSYRKMKEGLASLTPDKIEALKEKGIC